MKKRKVFAYRLVQERETYVNDVVKMLITHVVYTTDELCLAYDCADAAFSHIIYTASFGNLLSHAGSPGPLTVGCQRTGRFPAATTAAADTFAVHSA